MSTRSSSANTSAGAPCTREDLKKLGDELKALITALTTKVTSLEGTTTALNTLIQDEVVPTIKELTARVSTAEVKVKELTEHDKLERERYVRFSFTKADGGPKREDAIKFVKTKLAVDGKYGREHDEHHTLEGWVVYQFKNKQQQGAAGNYRDAVEGGVDCWAVIVKLNNIYDARRIRACRDLRGPGKFFRVGQQLTPTERDEKAAIQANSSFRAAATRYRENTGKWPSWNFASCYMGSEVWNIQRVLAAADDNAACA